jgi:predicted NBD/HSP70 family sugar kinase
LALSLRRRPKGPARADLLQAIVRERRIARQRLVELTGFAPATVSRVVAELIDKGWVQEVGADRSVAAVGRPPVLLEVNGSASFVAAVHIGDRYMSAALASLGGDVVSQVALDHEPSVDPVSSLRRVADRLRQMVREAGLPLSAVPAVGASCNGAVDPGTGVLSHHPRLGWRQVPVRDVLMDELRIATRVDTTANSLVLAEGWLGAARGSQHALLVLLGNAITCGLLANGTVYQGAHNNVGQIGHVQVALSGPRCYCGKSGCLESVASDLAILERANKGPDRFGTMDEVVDAAEAGDRRLQALLAERAAVVGRVLAVLAGLCDPERIVIAGVGARSERHQIRPIAAAIAQHALPHTDQPIEVVPSAFRSHAYLIGAVVLALEALQLPGFRGSGVDEIG